MLRAVQAAGCEARLYSIRPGFGIFGFDPHRDDLVLAVNYFGLTADAVDDAINRFGGRHVIVDAAQAAFGRPHEAAAILYSPRKFAGFPDGGILATDMPVPMPAETDILSEVRAEGLCLRALGRVEEGYQHYRQAERSLEDPDPKRMSEFTAARMPTAVREWGERRRYNYLTIEERLSDLADYVLPLPKDGAPLCFPLIGVDALRLRPILAAQRIYTPTYWPDIIDADNLNPFELTLRDRTLYLPIDQRYGAADMERLAEAVRAAVRGLGTGLGAVAGHAL
jgi:dTDP-4-amino-4,6-dideoxygalactose transaminase